MDYGSEKRLHRGSEINQYTEAILMRRLGISLLFWPAAGSAAFRPQAQVISQEKVREGFPPHEIRTLTSIQAPKTGSVALFVSAAMDQDEPGKQSAKKADDTFAGQQAKGASSMEMPWSEVQAWQLRDNLPRYTRILPGETPKTCALWRTMMQEVPELSGYPIDFLRKQVKSDDENLDQSPQAPEVLPYLDDFYFELSGGLSGQVWSNHIASVSLR